MAQGSTSAGSSGTAAPSVGQNPFWEVTCLFAQKNKQGQVTNYQLGSSTLEGGGEINPGNFLRGLRLMVRSKTGSGGTVTADAPFSIFRRLGITNTDGAEILYSAINGYGYVQRQRFGRPWLQDPAKAYDYSDTVNPAFTVFLQPEVRQQLGVLENTDTRSQYRFTLTLAPVATVITTPTTAPTVTVTPYADMWAQPDDADLEGVPNQRIPAGANLQTKTRHQVFSLNAAGSGNSLLSTLTGNAVRFMLLIVRNSANVREDYIGTPVQWQLTSRNLGTLSPTMIFAWSQDFYRAFGGVSRPTGVYPLPRFYEPGTMYGQGWLYTANSTALSWTFPTATGATTMPGTVELIQEEVYAVGAVDPSLIDI